MEEKDHFKRFISDSFSKKDYLKVVEFFQREDDFDTMSEDVKRLWDEFEYENIDEDQRIRIQKEIKSKIQVSNIRNRKTIIRRIYATVHKVAVVLLIPFIVASIFLYYQLSKSSNLVNSFAEIHCPLGTRTKFNLPDGSSGWLNSGSILKYSVRFNENRNVELNGEAFFDVVKNEKVPFEVNTKHFQIAVLGTKFNVASYNDDDHFAVTLETGKVKILENDSPHQLNLDPGCQFAFDKGKSDASIKKINTQLFTSWKDGQMMFRNTPFSNVLVRLGRWYNVDFICDDKQLLDLPYRATFQEETLDHVLQLLTLTAPIKYKKEEPKLLSNGTYEKQRIYIIRK